MPSELDRPRAVPQHPETPADPLAPSDPPKNEADWLARVYRGDVPQLTWRAVITGGLLGMLMAVGNQYVILKSGLNFGVGLSACVLSYGFWSLVRRASAGRLGQLTLLENNCMQSTASAAGFSTGATLTATFAALMMLDPEHRHQPWWVIAAFTLVTATMGVLLALPVKRLLVNQEQLTFPTGTATAATLRSLYADRREALQTGIALLAGMLAGAVSGILSTAEDQFAALGRFFAWMRERLFDVHLPPQWPERGFALLAGKPMVSFGFEPDLMMIAFGMIVGLRVALSMLAAGLVLHLFLAPWLQAMDAASAGVAGYVPSIPAVGGGTRYFPLRWSLWGGASLLVFASLTSLALQWRTVLRALRPRTGAQRTPDDAAMAAVEVPGSWMLAGMIPAALAMIALQVLAFHVAWWAGLIAIVLSALACLVVARTTGETDLMPTGALGKVMQLTFAVIAPPAAVGVQASVAQNLFSAGIASSTASASADLLSDLKSGYLLGAHPRRQFLAQVAGVFFGTLVCVPAWYLLVPDAAALDRYPMPAAQVWLATAKALTGGLSMLPPSVLAAVVFGAFAGMLLPVLEQLLPRARRWLPSAIGFGMGWVTPFSIGLSLAIGALIATAWKAAAPASEERYRVPLASGVLAGESILKALLAMLATALGMMA